jgi:transketolase
MDLNELPKIAAKSRALTLQALAAAGSGHTAGSMSITDVLTYLYFQEMNVGPSLRQDPSRDRFVLSSAHMVPALYSTLALKGYFPESQLTDLRKFGSPLQGHTFRNLDIGIETTGGSLGQGLSVAIGFALAARLNLAYKKPTYNVYALISDGESNEGQIWEAAMCANKYQLSNLYVVLDRNGIQQSNTSDEIMPLGSLADKWRAFGWNVYEIDGHDFHQLAFTFAKAHMLEGPTMIIANTVASKGLGEGFEGDYKWHGKAPSQEQAAELLKTIG